MLEKSGPQAPGCTAARRDFRTRLPRDSHSTHCAAVESQSCCSRITVVGHNHCIACRVKAEFRIVTTFPVGSARFSLVNAITGIIFFSKSVRLQDGADVYDNLIMSKQ